MAADVALLEPGALLAKGKARASEQAYETIEQLITTLQLAPNEPIVVHELAARTGLGRTPLREALMRMVTCGLVEQEPRRGLRVGELRVAEHLSLLDTRQALEYLIADSSVRKATKLERAAVLQAGRAMLAAAAAGDLAAYMQADRRLDQINHAACHNPFAAQAIAPMIVQCRRFWYAHQSEGDLQRGAQGHFLLAKGIHDHDAALARTGVDTLMQSLFAFTRAVIS